MIAGIAAITAIQTYSTVLYRDLIDLLTAGTVKQDLSPALFIVFVVLGINGLEITIWRIVEFVNNYFTGKVMSDLANTCFSYLQEHSYGFFTSKFVGSLVTKVKRFERSFETIQNQFFFDLGRAFLITGMILAVLLWQYTFFGLIMLLWCIVYLGFSYYFAKFKLPYDIRRSRVDTEMTGQLADAITNNVNVKSFSNYSGEFNRFSGITNKQFLSRKKSWDMGTIGEGVQAILVTGLEFLIIYLAVRFWQSGVLTVGDVVLLQAYFIRMYEKLWNTGKNIRNMYEALADANEMTELLVQPHSVVDLPDAPGLKVAKGAVEFRDVSFGYHAGQKILDGFSLAIPAGERVALIGPSGGGKSTILKLLTRFYDLGSGSILVDGQNIAQVTQDSLRSAISLVPQDPILFHRTLAENIRYARPGASDEEVITAAKFAHAHEFIEKSQHGYQTLVGERGIKLSGGERQRIAIARAILKDAPILILDEATSSLDSESEMFIQDALKNLMKGRTTIVVAHRLSTIIQMDRIVVIAGGKIIEQGNHKELLKVREGTYQKLWHIQAGGFVQ